MAIKGNYPLSTKNSTDKVLVAGGAFTGGADALSITEDSQSVTVTVYTDTDSAYNGLQLQFSADGTNWDHIEKYTVLGGKDFVVEHNMEYRYFRVVYQTLSAQGVFRLQTKYNKRRVSHTGAKFNEAVRLSDGTDWVDVDRFFCLLLRTTVAVEELVRQQKITNLHLKIITNQELTEQDPE